MIEAERRKCAWISALEFRDFKRIELSLKILELRQGRLLAQLLIEQEQDLAENFAQSDQKNPVLDHDHKVGRQINT